MSKNSNLIIYGYSTKNSDINKFIKSLPTDEKYSVITVLKNIQKEGSRLLTLNKFPYETKKIKDNVFEIKIDDNRLMYCYVYKGKVCILSAFKKKTQKTPKHEIEKALSRAKEILDEN